MTINSILESVFLRSSTLEKNRYYQIRKDSFFLNDDHHQHFLRHGWCKIEDAVKDEEIQSFMDTFREINQIEELKLDKEFINTGCVVNSESRTKTQDIINHNVKSIFPRMFNMNKVETQTGGSFVIKPPHQESKLETHQDSSFIDEEKDYSLFIWIPFCDVNETNGSISVLPGSHLWGNTQRGFCLPWNLEKHIPTLNKYMEPVYGKKGDVLIFDPAIVHRSGPNLSNETRHAVTLTAVRKNPDVIFYYKNPALSDKWVEKYHVDESFFRFYDFESKPDETKWPKEIVKYKPFDITHKQLLALIKRYLPR